MPTGNRETNISILEEANEYFRQLNQGEFPDQSNSNSSILPNIWKKIKAPFLGGLVGGLVGSAISSAIYWENSLKSEKEEQTNITPVLFFSVPALLWVFGTGVGWILVQANNRHQLATTTPKPPRYEGPPKYSLPNPLIWTVLTPENKKFSNGFEVARGPILVETSKLPPPHYSKEAVEEEEIELIKTPPIYVIKIEEEKELSSDTTHKEKLPIASPSKDEVVLSFE